MILRKYGSSYQSVDLNFDSKALTEVGFRRNHQFSLGLGDLDAGYELVDTRALVAEAEGEVQDHTEQVLLDRLEGQIDQLLGELTEGEVLIVENESGHDYPKTKQTTRNVVIESENRLRFTYAIAPPLRVCRYRPKA